ncbi:MAG: DMT family transporter [Pseudomonadota bacterium]
MPLRPFTRAILYLLISIVLLDAMGLIIKRLSPDYTAAELSAYRNIFGLLPAAVVLWRSPAWHEGGRVLRMRQWRLAAFRGVVLTGAQLTFYLSLGALSFATASTITYSNALFLVALAVPILGEKVGAVRWGAVMLGFGGVIWVVGPGQDTFTLEALLPICAAFCYALVGVTARLFDADVSTALINLTSASVASVCAVLLVPFFGGFTALVRVEDLAWIFAMGMFGGSAVLLLVTAYRMAEQSDLAPFSYFGIPIAFAMGWIFFGEAPWDELFPGALLIVGGGLIIIWRERRLRAR